MNNSHPSHSFTTTTKGLYISSLKDKSTFSIAMNNLHIVLFSFLVTVLYLSSHYTGSSTLSIPQGRKPPRKLSISFINKVHENPKIKVTDGESETSTVQESSTSNIGDLVYQIDYHGVTTHPTPNPSRHSKP